MTVLVFGAHGQVGRELSRQVWPDGLSVVALSRSEADIADRDAVNQAMRTHHPRLVVNAAAYTAVDKAESEPDAAFAGNEAGPRHVAEACAAAEVPLVHISTDYVFDGTKSTPYTEEDPVAPLGVYGRSKEAGEQAVRAAGARHVILRTAWVFSPFGHNFVKTMLRLGAERSALQVVDDQYGCPTAAADIAQAIVTIGARLIADETAPTGTFHFCGAGTTTWCGLARQVFEVAAMAGRSAPTVEGISSDQWPTPVRRPENSALDCGKVQDAFGIAPRPWPQAVERVVRELLSA